jgi:hypothetical protein
LVGGKRDAEVRFSYFQLKGRASCEYLDAKMVGMCEGDSGCQRARRKANKFRVEFMRMNGETELRTKICDAGAKSLLVWENVDQEVRLELGHLA